MPKDKDLKKVKPMPNKNLSLVCDTCGKFIPTGFMGLVHSIFCKPPVKVKPK